MTLGPLERSRPERRHTTRPAADAPARPHPRSFHQPSVELGDVERHHSTLVLPVGRHIRFELVKPIEQRVRVAILGVHVIALEHLAGRGTEVIGHPLRFESKG